MQWVIKQCAKGYGKIPQNINLVNTYTLSALR